MKLDTSNMRYLTADDFKVLRAVEFGSRDHELVPVQLIHRNSGMRSMSGTNRSIGDLAKLKLVSKQRNAKYDGYVLTYNGFDYIALKSLLEKNAIYSVGNTIGVGKESDIYQVSDAASQSLVMKIHRLGRTSFHTVKTKREYLKRGQSANWMRLSHLSAEREYAYMCLLHSKGFSVPRPYANARHAIVMEYIRGYPMRRLRSHPNVPKLYSDLMAFVVRLANHGLIHCDFNEFNIMIKDEIEGAEDQGFVVIDFPQCISIQHQEAEYYFKRDVDCIRRFFKKKLKYEPKSDRTFLDTDGFGDGFRYAYPVFSRDVTRCDNLDELVMASGFKKQHPGDRDLEQSMEAMRNTEYTDDEGSPSDSEEDTESEEYDELSDDESEEEDDLEEENNRIIEALSTGVGKLKMDNLGNYILEE
ncbi:AaceriABL166Wp [[Ashbya] aceris (nom. inval.)]|nr:AaceriABL166Wp [[Ashbya] aceris (nom. inval.)]